MTFGAQVKNDDQDIIIDSDFGHYHFIGKASYETTVRVPNIVGGNQTDHSKYNEYNKLDSSQVNGDIIKYKITTASGTIPPMCFIKPATVSNTAPPCSVILTKRVPQQWYQWEIWVLQRRGGTAASPTSYTRPTIYCFMPLDKFTNSQLTLPATETVGVAMYNSLGRATFDTRYKPLKVIKTQTINAPSVARTNPDFGNHNPDFTPNKTTSYAHGLSSTSDLMYYAPSLAHACHDASETRDGEGVQEAGNKTYQYHWVRADTWWAFYRNSFRLTSTNFQSTYNIYATGHIWESAEEDSWIGIAVIAAVVGALTGGAGLALIGAFIAVASFDDAGLAYSNYYPYRNGSRNADQDVQVIYTRPSYYD